jgi:hypothetical protein
MTRDETEANLWYFRKGLEIGTQKPVYEKWLEAFCTKIVPNLWCLSSPSRANHGDEQWE